MASLILPISCCSSLPSCSTSGASDSDRTRSGAFLRPPMSTPSTFNQLGRDGFLGMAIRKASTRCRTDRSRVSRPFCVRAGIRAVETYDASFELEPESDRTLRESLSSKVFCAQVAEQSMQSADSKYEFTGELFQPVPWSPTTKFGMPQQYEKFLQDKENFVIINVPPNFMFQAKIFRPSRLCAVYRKV